MDKMPYSPKLKKAMMEIIKILKHNDIGAIVILHTDTQHSEFLMKVDPSYSCIKYNGTEIRIKSSLADFNGDQEAQADSLSASVNMLIHFADMTKMISQSMGGLIVKLKEQMDIEKFGPDEPTSHLSTLN